MPSQSIPSTSKLLARRAPPPSASEPYGIDWSILHPGSIIVDVGGGLGASCLNLANTYPHVRFVVQDRPGQLSDAQLANAYLFASNGRVTFQAHDIFAPQRIRTAALFVLKHIVPGLSDSEVRDVLSRLRAVAAPGTQLVLLDNGEHEAGRTSRHVSQLLKSAGWGVAGAHSEVGRMQPLRAVFATPV